MPDKHWRIDLLPRDLLIKTGPVDEGDWHYRPLLRLVMRKRIGLMGQLLRQRKFHRLLDLGYGSGILLPELNKHCDELHGLDIHPHAHEVEQKLRTMGIAPKLAQGSAEAMPYTSNYFDAVVAMSSLEFIADIDRAFTEVSRVLAPGGELIFVSPEKSVWGDRFLRWTTGRDSRQIFHERRERLREAVPRFFDVVQEIRYSPLPGLIRPIYRACRALPRLQPTTATNCAVQSAATSIVESDTARTQLRH